MAARRVKRKAWSTSLHRKSERKQGGYPVGTIAFYGPDNRHASKVAVGIAPEEGVKIDLLERWFKEDQ